MALTDDPLAIRSLVAAELAVTLTPRLMTGELRDIPTAAVAGDPVRRTIYAVTPPVAAHPLAGSRLDAVRAQARYVAA